MFNGAGGVRAGREFAECIALSGSRRKAAEAGTPLPRVIDGAVLEKSIGRLEKSEEIQLIKTLGQFPLHLERTLEHRKASQLANFLIALVKAYGHFYRECHVLGQAKELTTARLLLVEATRRVLAQGLEMLGIPLPERM